MKFLAKAMAFFWGCLMATEPTLAGSWCDIPSGHAMSPAKLTIGEYGAFANEEYCPDLSQKLGNSFSYPARGLNIILRLEGGQVYLASAKAKQPITAFLRKRNANRSVSGFLTIGDAYIEVDAAIKEADLKDGYFDWRFRVQFTTIIRPGVYTLVLRQGGEEICPSAGTCQIVVEIKGGER